MRRGVRAELLMIGTELLLGQTVDTNAAFIAEQCANNGIHVYYKTTVGDNRQRLLAALSIALLRSDVIITSGGLGPTEDDLTRGVVAAAVGVKLVEDATAMGQIESWFRRHQRPMPASNRKQALMPEGALVLKNDKGTAPGFIVRHLDKAIVCLPGVPAEMTSMLTKSVLPYLHDHYELDATLYSHILRFSGIGESELEERLIDLFRSANPTVAPYASPGEVKLRLTARASSAEEAQALFQPLEQEIVARVGEYMYGSGDDTLEAVVGRLLRDNKKTVAVAESCTGGLIAKRLTDIPGSSDYFQGGVVAYSNDVKEQLLGVSTETLQNYGAVSKETAQEMAEGVARRLGANIGVAVTGIAGPGGGSDDKPVGLVFIGVWEKGETRVRQSLFGGERELVRLRATQTALDMLRRKLQTTPPLTTSNLETVAQGGAATKPKSDFWVAVRRDETDAEDVT